MISFYLNCTGQAGFLLEMIDISVLDGAEVVAVASAVAAAVVASAAAEAKARKVQRGNDFLHISTKVRRKDWLK